LAHTRLCIQRAVAGVHPAGFPHSEILGSKPACGSPRLIAACHVLRRLLAPRHPPYALSSLIIKLTQPVLAVLGKNRAEARPLQNNLSTFRLPQLHTSSHQLSACPGMGLRSRPVAPCGATRKLTQAFDSTVFGEPCCQFASDLSYESPATNCQSRL